MAPGYEVEVGSGSTAPTRAGSWTSMRALRSRLNLTVGIRPEEYETEPSATWTLSGTGSSWDLSDAAKKDV